MKSKKDLFRKKSLNILTKSKNQLKRNAVVIEDLINIIKIKSPSSVLLYLPLKNEINLEKLLKQLRRMKIKVYVPFMLGKSFKMIPYRLPLSTKKFGIREPNFTYKTITQVDIAIVPVVGVDAVAKRIGFGKGMYDRFFATLNKKPITIFTQMKTCLSREIISDDYDIQADIYITPEKKIFINKIGHTNDRSSSLRWRSCHNKRRGRFSDREKI